MLLTCETCGARFSTAQALQVHVQDAYHGVQCLFCGTVFARCSELYDHACHGVWPDHAGDGYAPGQEDSDASSDA